MVSRRFRYLRRRLRRHNARLERSLRTAKSARLLQKLFASLQLFKRPCQLCHC